MSDNKKLYQQRDPFSSYVQQHLKDHRLPPDKSCWDEIEQRLQRRRLRLFIRSGLCVVGAAVLALLLLMNIPTNEEMGAHYDKFIEEFANSEVKTDSPIDNLVINAVSNPLPLSPSKGGYHAESISGAAYPLPEGAGGGDSSTIPPVAEENTKEDEQKDTPAVNEKKKSAELPVLPDKQISLANKARQKRDWQVSAGLTAMGNNSLGNGEVLKHSSGQMGNDYSSGGWIPSTPDFAAQLQPDNCDDISYNLPLSFGITARKTLGKRLSLETGLVYTYLSTNLRKNSPTLVKGKLSLHYLGIPVNLIIDLWDNPKWDVYASTGVMVEKGLRSVYTQHIYRANAEEKATVKTSISGFQWSLNGALGISYRVQRDWSLYAEPRISYFFDNNQPISVRTDKPITLGFGLGVRFDF